MRVLPLLLAACACFAQPPPATQPLSQDTLRLARLRQAASSLFDKLPNFTCTLTIERSRRQSAKRKFELIDNLRLEVAVIEGKELYAWPGSNSFDDRELFDMVGAGAIGDGDFSTHARNIILSHLSTLKFEARESVAGRPADRWRFHYPSSTSEYTVRIPPFEGLVGYTGTLRTDSSNNDLIRIEMEINEIPPQLPLKLGLRSITYERVPIGESSYLLPMGSDLTLVRRDGFEFRNRTRFSGCRIYTAESSLSFVDVAPTAAPKPSHPVALPAGLEIQLRPVAPIDFSLLAVGDRIRLTAARDAVSGGQVHLPSGALVDGRVMELNCRNTPVRFCLAFLRLESYRFGNSEGEIRAVLESPSIFEQMAPAYRELDRSGMVRGFRLSIPERPGMSPVFVHDKRWKDSTTTVWRTH